MPQSVDEVYRYAYGKEYSIIEPGSTVKSTCEHEVEENADRRQDWYKGHRVVATSWLVILRNEAKNDQNHESHDSKTNCKILIHVLHK